MGKCHELQLLLIVCYLLLVCRSQNVQFCPVVSEGSPFSYSCVTPSSAGFIIWERTDQRSGKLDEITRCALSASDCDSNIKQFVVHNRRLASGYNSTVQITSAAFDDRFHLLSCRYLNSMTPDLPAVLLKSCRVAVYREGNSVNCTSSLQQDGSIRLSCLNAYPGISCYFFERLNTSLTRTRLMNVENRTLEESPQPGRFGSSCSELVYPWVPGFYAYDFYVSVGDKFLKVGNTSRVLDVRAKPVVTVGQSPKRAPLCQTRSEVEVSCNVTFMTAKPEFRFFLGNKELTNLSVKNLKYGNTKYTTYQAVGMINVSQINNGVLMRCDVQYLEGQESTRLNDTKNLRLTWPPPVPPKFTGDDGDAIPLGETLEIKKGYSSRVTCAVKGGEPVVDFVDVSCQTGNQVVSSNRSYSGSVSVTIHGNATYNRTSCVCSAQHGSSCYNSTSQIRIAVTPLGVRGRDPKARGTDKTYYIVAVVVFLIVAVVVVVVSYTVCKHGDALYSRNNIYANYIRRNRQPPVPSPDPNVPPQVPPPRVPPRAGASRLVPNATGPSLGDRPPRQWRDDPDLKIVDNGAGPRIVCMAGENNKRPRVPLNATADLPVYPSTRLDPTSSAPPNSTLYLPAAPTNGKKQRTHDPLTDTFYLPMLPPSKKASQPAMGASTSALLSSGQAETEFVSPPFGEHASERAVAPVDNHSFGSLGFQPPTPCGCPAKSSEPCKDTGALGRTAASPTVCFNYSHSSTDDS